MRIRLLLTERYRLHMAVSKGAPKPEELRKEARVLVIDDEPFPYLDLFSRDGYHITKWGQIENLSQLTDDHFSLILLDLNGIAAAEAPTMQGLGVLEHVKQENPTQLIVAYSAQDWGVEAQKFLHLADGVLGKSEDYVVFKTTVDELLKRRFSIGYYLERINAAVGDKVVDVPKLVPKAARAMRRGDTRALSRYLNSRLHDQVTIDRIMQIAGIGIGVLSLL